MTPRPYPTPTGRLVIPQVPDIPVFPGAREVDGFTRRASAATDVEETVQVYATDGSELAVLLFYQEQLEGLGFQLRGKGGGSNGQDLELQRGKDSAVISTRYIARPDDPYAGEYPPYGYLGGQRWNLEFEPGMRYFFVVTLRAP